MGKLVYGESWEIPPEYKISAFDSVGQGKAGAFLKMVEIAASSLTAYRTMLGDNDFVVLLKVFFAAIETKHKVLSCKQNTEVMENVSIFQVFESQSRKYREDAHFHIIIDAVKSICGYGSGNSLYSHLVLNAIEQAINSIDLVLINNTLIVGAATKVGGVDLLKY